VFLWWPETHWYTFGEDATQEHETTSRSENTHNAPEWPVVCTREGAWHYGKQRLPLVSNALGEGPVALGEEGPGVSLHGKDVFHESRKSCTRVMLSREPSSTRGRVDAVGEQTAPLTSLFFFKIFLPRVQHSRKTPSSPSAAAQALGEETLFPERCNSDTRGRNPLPRAPQPRHSGKEPSSPSAAAQALGEAYFFYFF